MNPKNPKVEGFFRRANKWQEEFERLRKIALGCRLTEELKWGKPCYLHEDKNIVLIQGFKEYCAFLFFDGALLKDAKRILVKPGENSQASRQARFTDVREIVKLETVLKAYIREAVEARKAGLKVKLKKTADYKMPEELRTKLDESPAFETAFAALTPGRQRAYILHIAGAKQSTTRESRVEKCMPQILAGKGMND